MIRRMISIGMLFSLVFIAVSISLCGSIFAFALPDTGQILCYDSSGNVIDCAGTGQDGEYLINPISYTDNGDGTVTDNNTGLTWQKCSVGQNNDVNCSGAALAFNWYQASGTYDQTYNSSPQDVCGSLNLGGHSDWRLPTSRKELNSLVDYHIAPYSLPINIAYFPNTKPAYYWVYASHAYFTDAAELVSFNYGWSSYDSKTQLYYVRCVRGQYAPQNFTDNSDGTVTDSATGLMWQQGEPEVMKWGDALAYCNGLTLANYSDWRLPNERELVTIVDETKFNPAINTEFFPNASTLGYWSSTTNNQLTNYAFFLNSANGGDGGSCQKSTWDLNVKCVRGGLTPPTVIPGKLSLSPAFHDFVSVNIGSCSQIPQQFTLSNTGGTNIVVSSIKLSDSENFAITLTAGSNPCNIANPTILPRNSCTVAISFCPSIAGSFNANLDITSNDPDKKVISVPLSDTGVLQTKGKNASGQVVIIDGIQILSILDPSYPDDYSHYLMDEIGDYWIKTIQKQVGPIVPFIMSPQIQTGIVVACARLQV